MNWKYFTLKEMIKSSTADKLGFDNTPNEEVEANLDKLVNNVLDPLREKWKMPIKVTSGYRCKKLNDAVGGVKSSQHLKGQAADIQPLDYSLIDKFIAFVKEWCKHNEYDQCIIEMSKRSKWVHISYNEAFNRKKCFMMDV